MVSTKLDFTITTPTEGQHFRLDEGIQARGVAHVTNVGVPTFGITGVDVQFGVGGPFVTANQPGGSLNWDVFGEPFSQNTVLTVTARCHITFFDGSGDTTAFASVQVVDGNLIPQVVIDPFDNDVTVPHPPYQVPSITGTASEPFADIGTVQWQLAGGPLTPVDSVSGGRFSTTQVVVPAGRHTVTFLATDPFGNTGSSSVDILVRVPVDPGDRDRAFARTAYLGELLSLAQRYVSVDGAPPGPSRADLENRLHQRFDSLMTAAAFAAATADVSQARLAVEVLRGVIPPFETEGIDQVHRQLAYAALLSGLGTSPEELRLARTAEPSQRELIALRVGVDLEPTRPDQLDRITMPSTGPTDAQLAQLFGYVAPVPSALDGPRPGSPDLLLARQASVRRGWRDADTDARDNPLAPRPLIVPEQLGEADFVSADPGGPARQLWSDRVTFRAGQLGLIQTAVAGANRTVAGLDAAVTTFVGAIDLVDLATRDHAGEDVRSTLDPVGLDKPTMRRLNRLRTVLADATGASGTLGDDDWAEIADHLLTANLRHAYAQWRRDEVERGIVLDPAVFAVRLDATAAGPDWRQTLATRAVQFAALADDQQGLLAAAEAAVLPQLRDALITQVGVQSGRAESLPAAADRLSRALAFDLRVQHDRRTTRVGQATESLQEMLTTARSGSYRPELGVPVLVISGEVNFDLEYEWLVTYDRWLSAIRAFAYPENQLQPQLYVPEDAGAGLLLAPTAAYSAFIKALSDLARPTPDEVRALAAGYLAALPAGQRPGGLVLTEQLDNAGLTGLQTLCLQLVQQAQGGTPFTLETQIPQNLREIFMLVPVAAARKLQSAGHFVSALDWFQTVYAYHLPAASRPVYYGLVLEQAVTSDYGRLPEWLSQVRELNPHFTARKRKGAYTRAAGLSVVECFLDYADSEFAQNTTESRGRALVLYQGAQDLVLQAEVAPEHGDTVPFPDNPVWQSLTSLAQVGLSKVHAGLDIAGQPAPNLAVSGDNVLPSPYRYSVLVDRAKALVGIAQQVETAYLSALERLDGENYALLQAGRDLQTAAGSLVAQDLRVDIASTAITQAGLQRDRAQLQFGTYDGWINGGLNDAEQTGLGALRVAEGLHGLAALTNLAGSWQIWNATGNMAGALAEAANVASTESQIQFTSASFERRNQEWQLNRGLADKDVQLAQSQLVSAQLQHQVAVQERQIASDQLTHAQAVAEFLATKFTNAELYDWMSGVLGKVYAFFLQQATALALTAQAQLAFERQELVSGFISADYWQPAPATIPGDQASADRRGITGSARLLADIFALDQHAFDTERRKLHLTQTILVSQVAAYELEQFRQTGVLTFSTPQGLFDGDFPGHYLRLVKQLSVSVIALTPAARGVRATLSASGVSRAVVLRDTFQTVTMRREPETIALTSPINANGLFALEPDGAQLRPFEGMGLDTVWQLNLPKAANPFDYRSIADVLLTVEYTALDSSDYREQVIRLLNRSLSTDRSFSVRDEFPDAWFDLNNPDTVDDPSRRMRVTVPVTADDLPQHVTDLSVGQLSLFVVRDDALTAEVGISSLIHTTAQRTIRTGPLTTVGGIVGTRRPGGDPWRVLAGADPAGTWEIQFDDTPEVRGWFTAGLIRDVVLVLTLNGTTPAWT